MKFSRVCLLVVLSVACGPQSGSMTQGTTDEAGDASAETTAASTGTASATDTTDSASVGSESGEGSSGGAEGSSGDTEGACADPAYQYFVPGCGEPSPEDVPIEPGCYQPCDDGVECMTGVCLVAWIDPCYGEPCGACGGQQSLCIGDFPTGTECIADGQCASGVCWSFNDYDRCCWGTMCTGPCRIDQDCADLAQDAGAPSPEMAFCGEDGRCNLISTGLPANLVCAGPKCG